MAMNASEAHHMRAVSRQKTHLIAQIVPSPMTLRVDNTIKRHIADGYIGDVLAVEARAGGAFLDSEAPLQWRQDFDLSGLNIMSMGDLVRGIDPLGWRSHADYGDGQNLRQDASGCRWRDAVRTDP